MSALDLDLDDRTFDQLVEAARSRLPALAPAWTDYNAHDPGITLVELMAWLGEAQIHALARLRRDEREVYAHFAGVARRGPQAAAGVIWPDESDPLAAVRALVAPTTLRATDPIRPADSDQPLCFAAPATLLLPGTIAQLQTVTAANATIDRTAGNARGLVAYEPFGPDAGPNDRLRIVFRCASSAGLAATGTVAREALWMLGVRVEEGVAVPPQAAKVALEVVLVAGMKRVALPVRHDDTAGWTRSGTLGFVLPAALPGGADVVLELRAPAGFPRAPRVRRVALNVIPVVQGRSIAREAHDATGLPDQVVELDAATLRYDGADDLDLRIFDRGIETPWQPVQRLDDAAPGDRVYVLDRDRGRVRFGNGINGAAPALGARIFASYRVCDAAAGNQDRPRAWTAAGVGPLGRNLDPLTGGADAQTLDDTRAVARAAVRERHLLSSQAEIAAASAQERHPLVTAEDLRGAALALTHLQVARAEVAPFDACVADPASVTLIVLRSRLAAATPASIPETRRWLDAVRDALQPRLPLGERLVVRAPTYVDFGLRAQVRVAPLRDPAAVKKAAQDALLTRLAATAEGTAPYARDLGLALTAADIGAWLRKVEGVNAVLSVTLLDARGQQVDRIDVGRLGLARADAAPIQIDAVRASAQGARS